MKILLTSLAILVVGASTRAADPVVRAMNPGVAAKRLPIDLSNVNGLAYAPDGTLYAVGYDGTIHRLVDTDGDGLEDRAEVFWDEKTLISPIQAVWSRQGLYVSSHLKVSLLIDDDKDGRADREEVVARGWPGVPSGSGLVDAMGIALDRDDNLYVSVGCADYANPYQEKDGKAHYRADSEPGTILKVAPDRKHREVFATGLRFAYALRFNKAGDLFATDQEGETWLEGANPLDELNHIVPGRHYGWPPRHPKFLPRILDEPPVAGFAPQHQSACGLAIDEVRDGRPRFGPEEWDGDALVAGYSRGKVWRVRLAKTASGYVARPEVLLAMDRLATDVAISPKGALTISAHSGRPDWGTGPNGAGDLIRVTIDDKTPQPTVAWASGPLEVRIAFDRPLDPAVAQALAVSAIPFGDHVRPGDRFEPIKPPYEAVERQSSALRGTLRVAAARLADDRRTLVLGTDPHPYRTSYAPILDGLRADGAAGPASSAEVSYDLSGVQAEFAPEGGGEPQSLWWPSVDARAVAALTRGSSEHSRFLERLATPGRLTLKTLVTLPRGKATVTLASSGTIEEPTLGGEAAEVRTEGGTSRVSLSAESSGQPIELAFDVTTPGGDPPFRLDAHYRSAEDATERPLRLDQMTLPWAPAAPPKSSEAPALPPALGGGDVARGEAVFFGEAGKCSTCHAMKGRGGNVGPDLSNQSSKSAAAIYHDILEPSATIHPDYVPFTVTTKDGRVFAGIVRSEGADRIRVIGTDAKATEVSRSEIEEIRPSATSIMPVSLPGAIGEKGMRDLLAYLKRTTAK